MKIIKLVLFLLIGTHLSSFAQTDSLKSESPVSLKTYKNNVKLNLFFMLFPVKFIDLSFQKALTQKSSLSLNAIYLGDYSKSGYRQFALAPAYSYFLTRSKKMKYNNGFYAKLTTPVLHESATYSTYRNIDIYLLSGMGYQSIVGRRLAINISFVAGRNIFNIVRGYRDSKFRAEFPRESPLFRRWYSNMLPYPEISVGYTF